MPKQKGQKINKGDEFIVQESVSISKQDKPYAVITASENSLIHVLNISRRRMGKKEFKVANIKVFKSDIPELVFEILTSDLCKLIAERRIKKLEPKRLA